MVRKKYSKKRLALGTGFILLAIFFLIFYLWHQTEIIRLGYETGKLEQKVLSLQEEVKKLEAKKSSLLSLSRVEKIAKEKLNLMEPGEEQVFYDDFEPLP